MANVTHQRKDYQQSVPSWMLVTDVCQGQEAVKARGDEYLPRPNPTDKSEENRARFKQYLLRAVFYNATGRTLTGLIGAAFRKPPAVEVPSLLDYLKEDADGQGVGIFQHSQNTLSAVLKKGRAALWVDYPEVNGDASRAQQAAGAIRANVIAIGAEQVINWRVERQGARNVLSLVVIRETFEDVSEDGFVAEAKDQYRVLALVEGVYTVRIYRQGESGWELAEEKQPKNGTGGTWSEIPFIFIGAQDNNADIDTAPLYDLAVLNIAHYRNSADYEDSAYLVGQAQPWISGLTEQWRNHMEENGNLYLGSRTPLLLPENGAYGVTQAEANSMVKEAMDQKERQMVAIGARLVEKGSAVKTATQAQDENESEHSVLSLVVENVSDGYRKAIGWAAQYMNASGEIEFALNTEFAEATLDAQMLQALVKAWQASALPLSALLGRFREVGLIEPDVTDEEVRDEIEAESVDLGLGDAEPAAD